MSYANKVALVTGASSGIGAELARQLAAQGARLVLADCHDAGAAALPADAKAKFIRTDVSQEADVVRLFQEIGDEGLTPDYVFSNAGVHLPMDADASEDEWARLWSTNVMGNVRMGRGVLRALASGARPHFVVTASAAGLISELTSVGYATTKYATVGYAEWMAYSYQKRGLKVSVVCPEGVHTPMIRGIDYLEAGAISPQAAVAIILKGVLEDKYLITTHAGTLERFQQKAADMDGFVKLLAEFRDQALPG